MKVQASVKKYKKCPTCQVVRRPKGRGRKGAARVYIICDQPRHRQRQG